MIDSRGGSDSFPVHPAAGGHTRAGARPLRRRGRNRQPAGRLLSCKTWGCELFTYRAENAAARMDKCHSAAWENCSLTDESVTLLWCNPPYDDDRQGDEKRLEFAFLKSTTPNPSTTLRTGLVRGGVPAFINSLHWLTYCISR